MADLSPSDLEQGTVFVRSGGSMVERTIEVLDTTDLRVLLQDVDRRRFHRSPTGAFKPIKEADHHQPGPRWVDREALAHFVLRKVPTDDA